jgi:hypothetical protein
MDGLRGHMGIVEIAIIVDRRIDILHWVERAG